MVIPFNLVKDLLKYDCYILSNKIICPTIFINGDKDASVPIEYTKDFYETLKCPKKLIILEDCEHVMRTEKNLQDLEQAFLKNI
jgi:esterase/lipase